jgi:hypothetical protein
MDDLDKKIKLTTTEMNLTQDAQKRNELSIELKIIQFKKEIEDIKKRIEILSSR